MLTVPGIDPKRIKCEADSNNSFRVRLDTSTIARIDGGRFFFDGNWDDLRLLSDARTVLRVVIPEWLASGGTRLWPPPPPDLLEVAKEMLLTTYSKSDYFRLAEAIAAEEAKRVAAKEAK